jgi:UDPglucose--hexose-1-phosphate uridylyltransferase
MCPVGDLCWKDSGKLADGREIIYFDETPGLGRARLPDLRRLPARPPPAELRWDALAGEWVIIAGQRQDRTFQPPAPQCPLCPSAPGRLTEIPAPGYDVVVFENRFPALPAGVAGVAGGAAGVAGVPGGPGGATTGRCEMVCFTSHHDASFASLAARRVRTVLEAWADRTAVLGSTPGIAQVYCFENRGEQTGVTLDHPHGQIYGFPFVTPRTAHMLSQLRAHAEAGRGNLFDRLVAGEQVAGTRIVASNQHWTAFVPAAARWPYEILLFPAQRVPSIPALGEQARQAFCEIYPDLLRRFDALFGMPLPYIAAWHQAPARSGAAGQEFGLHLQLMTVQRAPGKLKYLAGSESGMGTWINDITPEHAAAALREAG